MKKIFAIISGEPNSINSEIIAKSWKKNNTYYKKNVFIIGSYLLIKEQLQNIGIKIPLEKIKTVNNFKTKNVLQILEHVYDQKVSSNFSNITMINCFLQFLKN